jgi:hypothetical protein
METQDQILTPEEQQKIETCHPLVGDDWAQVQRRIPVDVEGLAQETQALQRKREVKSVWDLLRMALAYSLCDWSFRQVGVWATLIGLGRLSDVAVRKRLRKARAWLGRLVGEWLQQRRVQLARHPVRVRLIDATTAHQPGSQGTDWRLHLSFDLGQFCMDGLEVTDARGGETLVRHAAQAGEILVVDRGYAQRRGLGSVLAVQGRVVARMSWQNLPLETADGRPFDILAWAQTDVPLDQPAETLVWITHAHCRYELRLIAQRLPPEAAEEARRRVHQAACKKSRTPSQATLLAAEFIWVVTNLPTQEWPVEQILALYRLRWQVELVFKRLKGILDLEQLRAKDPEIAQVYLLGKMVAALILQTWTDALPIEWMLDTVHPLSPWRWMTVWVDALRQAVRGPLTLEQCWKALPKLARYLRDSPRKRRQQLADARQWLQKLGIAALSNNVIDYELSLA